MTEQNNKDAKSQEAPHPKNDEELAEILASVEEIGGSKKEPTKHGDWSLKGKCVDF